MSGRQKDRETKRKRQTDKEFYNTKSKFLEYNRLNFSKLIERVIEHFVSHFTYIQQEQIEGKY